MTEPLALPTPSAEEAVTSLMRNTALDAADDVDDPVRTSAVSFEGRCLIARLEAAEQAAIEWQARYEAKCRAYDVLREFLMHLMEAPMEVLTEAEEAGRYPFS